MTKFELLERVARRAIDRYGQIFSEALLNDLLKDGLIPVPNRIENKGKAPNYQYNWRAYRRALQIVRLRRDGIVGRDAQRVILFLRDYSQSVWDVKEALLNEYIKSGKAVLSSMRSGYVDNTKVIPPKHKDSLLRSMGEPDDRLKKSKCVFDDETYIDAIRIAKQRPLEFGVPQYRPKMREQLSEGKIPPEFLNIFSGMLMFGTDEDDNSEEVDHIEKLIRNSSDKSYHDARTFYQNVPNGLSSAGALLFPNATDREIAIEAILLSIKNVPVWFSLVLVLGLKFVSNRGVHSEP